MKKIIKILTAILVFGTLFIIKTNSVQAGITYIGAGTLGAAANFGADPTAALPANTQTDDILVIHAWTRSTSDTTTITGFTEIAQVDTADGSHRWFWKRHDGSESNVKCNRTGTTGDSYCRMFAFRGVVLTGNPWNASGSAENDADDAGTNGVYTLTSITTGAANSMVLVLTGYQDNDETSVNMTSTDPADYTEVYSESDTGSDGSISIGYATRTAAGATGTITVDYASVATSDAAGSLVLSLDPITTCQWTGDTSTAWATGSNWRGCNGTGGVPAATDTVTIQTGRTYDPSLTSSVTIAGLTVSSGTLTMGASGALTINGNVTLSGGTLDAGSDTISLTGNWTNNGGAFTQGTSTVTFTGTGAQAINGTASGQTFSTLTVGMTAGQTLSVSGSTTTLNVTTFTETTGNFTSPATMTISGNMTLSAGTFDGSSTTLNLAGNMTVTSGAFTCGTGTVNYNGSGAQTIGAVTYNALKINNATGATLAGATTASSIIIGDTTGSSIFADGGNQITSTGTLHLHSGTFKLGNSSSTTFPAFSGGITIDTGTTVEYASTNAQTVSITPSYQNLIFSGAGVKTPSSGTLTVGGNWTVSSPTALDTNNNIANVTGNINGTGNITTGTGLITLGGDWTNTGALTCGTGGVKMTGTGKQITGPAGGVSFTTLTIDSSVTNNNTGTGVSATTALSGAGTLTQGTGSVLNIGGTSGITGLNASSNANTVQYNKAGDQTAKAVNYSTLVLGGSGAKTMTGITTMSALTISGSATMTGNAAFTLAGTLTYSSSGSTTLTGSTNISIGSMNQSAGVINDNGVTITVTGSSTPWTKSGGTYTTSGTVVFTANADIATLLSGTPNFYNLTLSPTLTGNHTYTFGVAPTITGAFTMDPKSANRLTAYLSADTVVTGTTNLSGSGSATSTLDTVNGQNRAFTTGVLTIGAAGTLTAENSTITVNGTDTTIFSQSGTLNPGGSTFIFSGTGAISFPATTTFNNVNISGTVSTSGSFSLTGNWTNTNSFTQSAGTVTFAGVDSGTQIITGNTTFANMSASTTANSAGRTLQFTGNSTTTVTGNWTIAGNSGKMITLESSDTNSWTITPTTSTVDYATVAKSTNTIGTICATHSTDGTGNSGWAFSAGTSCNSAPNTPSLDEPSYTASNQSITPALKTTAIDTDSNYLRYKIILCENQEMSTACQTFTQGATYPQTGWSGQDAATDGDNFTAYASNTQAIYTIQSALEYSKTYYWESSAIDPEGTNTYGATQGTPYSFETMAEPTPTPTPTPTTAPGTGIFNFDGGINMEGVNIN